MRLDDQEESHNIEDRRSGYRGGGFGGGRIGIGTIALALIASYFFGIDPMTVIDLTSNLQGASSVQTQAPAQKPPAPSWGGGPGPIWTRASTSPTR